MEIQKLQDNFAKHPGVKTLAMALNKNKDNIQLSGLQGSCAAMSFAAISSQMKGEFPFLFILDDEEEAGYFYHDLTQMMGQEQVLFFPSSYKRAIKYGQRDAGNEILRTEVLTKLSNNSQLSAISPLYIVSYPQALCELVVTQENLSEQTLNLQTGEKVDIMFVQETLIEYGFQRVDYVYEPGQFAVRGSIIDVYSYSCELPYRIDFFGDEVDSIRTFEVQSQLSRAKLQSVSLIHNSQFIIHNSSHESFLSFLPKDSLLVMKDPAFVADVVDQTYQEGFTKQAMTEGLEIREEELEKSSVLVDPEDFRKQLLDFRRIEISNNSPLLGEGPGVRVSFTTHPQPVFHKNFEMLFQSFQQYMEDGYQLYILADSQKQTDRLESIFEEQGTNIHFTAVDKTIHAGFVDDDLKACFFTDHQIFDRYHKYNLRTQQTRTGKVALTLKELQQFEIGDYVVHLDHGVGRFGGLVRIPNGDKMQEVIKIIYNHDDVVFVSIHALHKVSKYKGKEGEPPRISTLGTGAWERMKERTKTKILLFARQLYAARAGGQLPLRGYPRSVEGYAGHKG